MREDDPVRALHSLSRSFGRPSARRKLELLAEIAELPRLAPRRLLLLHSTLDFMRAYPDDVRVLAEVRRHVAGLRARVEAVPEGADSPVLFNQGFPGAVNSYPYSFEIARDLARRLPDCAEVDWDELEDETPLASTLELFLADAENESMESMQVGWREWLADSHTEDRPTDLACLLGFFERSRFTALEKACLFETCGLPIRYELGRPGTGKAEVESRPTRICFQTSELRRERFPLRPRIREPLGPLPLLSPARGRERIELARAALCSRNLEIHPLIYANPADVRHFESARGIDVVLIGVPPEHRSALSANTFFLVLKNGVPIAYGPASPFLGCCEMGINLFPEFRGGEIRLVYSQVMRLLHHLLGVDYFYLTSYGMGVDNEEAIQSGAFWFYRKMGFLASNPEVEALAREEEARMRAEPGYRCSTRTLRRLSPTEAYLDLTGGRRRQLSFARLGAALGRFIGRRFGGNRRLAEERCERAVVRALRIGSRAGWSADEKRALRRLAPVLAMIEDLSGWSARERAGMVRILRAKAARSEAPASRLMSRHQRLGEALSRAIESL